MNTSNTLTFKEILDKAFVDEFQDMSFKQALLVMAISLFCACAICFVYSKTFHGALFSRSYCASLFAMELITTLLVMAVRTNIYLSLGTIGAISIVRFRSAVKEPMDMAFMFLSICSGIVCGANLLGIAVFGVLLISLLLFVIGLIPKANGTYILVVAVDQSKEEVITNMIKENVRSLKLKSKSFLGSTTELTFEVNLKKEMDTQFVGEINKMEEVSNVSIIKSNGEFV